MRKLFLLFIFVFVASISFSQDGIIKVMTYNIRCGYCEDSSDVNNWNMRKYLVAYLIKNQNPDLIGLQEAELFQIRDLIEMLDNYNWYGVGREDGKEIGESAAVLFRKDKFTLEEHRTLWLSETPNLVSKGWDAAFNRTVTVAKLKNLNSLKEFYWFNTHFDHLGETARTESSKLIIEEVDKITNNMPVILTGDFNYTSSSEGYKIITSKLFDSKSISTAESMGGNITFNGFGKDIQPDNKIDFIFVNDNVVVLNHMIDKTTFTGLYPSDHYPVISEIKLINSASLR